MIDKETLLILNDAIIKIENNDSNYMESKTWQRLRKVQDEAFKEFAKQEIEYCKSKEGLRVDRDYSKTIKDCEEFLNFVGNDEEDNNINEYH